MKTEKQIRNKIKHLKLMIKKDPDKSELYNKWIDAMNWTLDEYCLGVDCAWCSNAECINM